MKERKVMLELEVSTDAPLSLLKRAKSYGDLILVDRNTQDQYYVIVKQAQANVVED